ncbi:hypothetical protein CARUB_v10021299mg, partial [Capsella rubella]
WKLRREEPWISQLDYSINTVSFGFVATAVLISLFLIIAIFERLIRTTNTTTTTSSDSSSGRVLSGLDSRVGFSDSALQNLIGMYSKGVSVLMLGDHIPIGYTRIRGTKLQKPWLTYICIQDLSGTEVVMNML